MTEQELQRRLERLMPEEPAATHQAFLHAVRSAEEARPKMKRKLKFAPVLAFILVLSLAVTAWALTNRASVTTTYDGTERSQEFLNNVVTIDQPYEDDYLTMSINDAVFDGQNFSIAMNVASKDPEKPVFVEPKLTASCNGQELYVDPESYGGIIDVFSGSMLPAVPGAPSEGELQGDYCLSDDVPDGPVTWTMTIHLLRSDWPVEVDDYTSSGQPDDRTEEEWRALYKEAFEQKKVLTSGDGSLVEYANYVPIPDGWTQEDWWNLPYREMLVGSGAFTEYATVTCSFTTGMPESAKLQRTEVARLARDGYSVVVDEVTVTFQKIAWRLHYEFDQPMTEAELKEKEKELPMHYVTYAGDTLLEEHDASGWGISFVGEDENGESIMELAVSQSAYVPNDLPAPTTLRLVPVVMVSEAGEGWHEADVEAGKAELDESGAITIPLN